MMMKDRSASSAMDRAGWLAGWPARARGVAAGPARHVLAHLRPSGLSPVPEVPQVPAQTLS